MHRIIFVIAVFLFSLSSVMGQMIPVNLPADGNWPTVVGDSIMIIGPRQNELTEEQRYFNPVYLMVYPGKEHLTAQMIRAGLCDCDLTKPNRRIGVFSVAPNKQVSFSQGNLQYLPAINLWKFANTQYEYLGNANKYLKPTFRNWVDLFGWSADNTTAPFGVSTSTNAADYAGDFVDWGTNTICGDAPGTWRTLSKEEWEYLLNGRENANKLRCRAQVNNVNGFVFLPDQWLCPEGIELKIEQLTTKVFTFDAWSKMENAGAVFLPAAGRLNDKQLVNFDDHGNYWSSTRIDNTNVDYFAFTFSTNKLHVDHQSPLHFARSVRLVHDTIVPRTIPDPCLVVKVNDTLSINMMCVEGGTFTMGDGENAHPVSLSSYSIGQTEVTQALWEAVMGTNPSANTANKQLPVTNISWYDCQAFINKLNQQTGLRFRLPTEAEWEYAARGGQKGRGYTYAGSNDLKEVAWYNGNSGNTLHAVAQKKPNELGIYDMSGNVWEWCHDWHAPYPNTHQYNPLGPEVGQIVGKRYLRVFRGGSYGYEAAYHQNTFRDITGPEPNIGTANLGLRLVLSDDVNFETIHVNDTLSFHMMDVKGGTFTMGDDNTSNASPAHQVTLSDYYIGQTEVTQALWKAVMGDIPTGNKNPSYPVGYVSYADCQNFIAKLNNLTGLYFQLPTEAEWEYAAMGGNRSHGYIYSGSNTIDDVAWYDQNSGNKLHHVGAKQPNELGIYDMSGNAWEWCADYHGKYTAENQINPQGPATGTDRVIRSGSFRTTADRCTNKHRQAREADYPDSHITLRLVLHDTVPEPPKRIGVFSVAADKQVSFSLGNLQYTQSTNTWQFAREQYEYIGAENIKDGKLADRIDLFGWSASGNNAPFGVSTSTNAADYAGDFVDWGVNTISGNAPGTWRTLSMEEWAYLFKKRTNAAQLYSKGSIEGTRGVIVLPDNWALPEGVQFTVDTANLTMDLDLNAYSYAEWQQMEEAGAVFLCVTGRRDGKEVGYLQEYGGYWSSTTTSITTYHWFFNYIREVLTLYDNSNRVQGRSVRLVHDTIVPEPPKRIGVFSVAADKQVSFSQGNLQYIQSTKTWQFANNQLEYMGHKHFRNGQLADTIEYFGWSGKNSKTPWGISLSTEPSDYAGEFLDWGTNTIAGSAPNTWRTLSNDEWLYICQGRKNADQLLGLGTIGAVTGLIILPDDWQLPAGLSFTPNTDNATKNQYTYNQWVVMENAGAVFIPPTGYFNHKFTNMRGVNEMGYYRGSTLADDGRQIYMLYDNSRIRYSYSGNNDGNLYYAFSVRLVHDTIVPETIPDPCLVVKVNDTLSINMMCVEGGMFMMGSDAPDAETDEQPVHEVTLSDYYIGQTEITQHLWKIVMGSSNNPSATKGDELPVTNITWDEAQVFVQKLSEMTGLHFRLPTEAEWEYAARGGQKSKGYTYAGSNDIDEVAWYPSNCTQPQAIGKKMPNELGIYDMAGNAYEWCYDWYGPYSSEPQTNPQGPTTSTNGYWIVRGGCWQTQNKDDDASYCRITNRGYAKHASERIGLRIVLEPTPEPEYVDLGLSVKWATFNVGARR